MIKFNNKVVYQIYPKSFYDSNNDGVGDLRGIINKFDYIKDLGVDYIWLCPVNTSPQKDNGYDIADYLSIDPLFGTIDDYKTFIDLASANNMKVMMDLVLNHTSIEHEWFQKALSGDKYYKDFYIWRKEPNDIDSIFGGSAWEYSDIYNEYYLHMFDVTQADLNWHNPNVREAVAEIINYWIDFGVEGFRLDVIDMIGKNVETKDISRTPLFYQYFEELNNKTFQNKVLIVGECWNASFDDAKKMHEVGITEVFHFEHLTSPCGDSKWETQGLDIEQLANMIRKWDTYPYTQTQVFGNHDLPRMISVWLNDQEYRYESQTLLMSLFSLLKGTLYIYQGEELGLTNDNKNDIKSYDDVESINAFNDGVTIEKIMLMSRDNSRTPMQWGISDVFSAVKPWINYNYRNDEINFANDVTSDKSVYKYYQAMINYRKKNYDTVISKAINYVDTADSVITIAKDDYTFIFNMTDETKKIGSVEVELSNYDVDNTNKLLPYQFIMIKNQEI